MKKEISINVPTSFSAVKLKDYINFQKDLENYGDDGEEAIVAVTLHHFSKIDPRWIRQIPVDTYAKIKGDVHKLLQNEEYPLQRIITIGDKQYGFEPDLNSMDYGLYSDISSYEALTISKEWAEIMSMLYRPITRKIGNQYQIEDYKGKVDSEPFMDISMDIHFGALFFLKTLRYHLLKTTLSSLMDQAEIPHNIKSTLAKSGELTPR
jgi:hypothetical protein